MKTILMLLFLTIPVFAAPSVEIIWEPVTTYEDGVPIEVGQIVMYEVWRSTSPLLTSPTRVGVNLTTVRCIDQTVVAKTTYYYYVRAYLVDGLFGVNSDPATARVWPPYKTTLKSIAVIK